MQKVILLLLSLLSAGQVTAGGTDPTQAAIQILFAEWEPGIDPYTTRTIVTPQMMRIDDNDDTGNYVLFDRKLRIVYSVTHDNEQILEIHDRPITVQSPVKLEVEYGEIDENDVPAIAGQPVKHYQIKTNGQNCMDIFAVARVLDDALAARREFQTVLASEHAASMGGTPADMLEVCDLSSNIFYPTYHLQFGFPVHQSTNVGFHRQMVSFDTEFMPNPTLFALPVGYRRYSPGMMRGE